jgi:general secretion pathway protein D
MMMWIGRYAGATERMMRRICWGILLLVLTAVAHAENIIVNLKDADIAAVVKMVSEKTGKTFVIDPRVKGKVTITSAKPMKSEELYQLFLAVLDVHGFAAISGSGGVIKIVPSASAKHMDGIVE